MKTGHLITVAAVMTLVGACGGNSSNGTGSGAGSPPTSNSNSVSTQPSVTQSFSGTVTSQPAEQTIELSAGEALRWWARPAAGSTQEISLAISTDVPLGGSPRDYGNHSAGSPADVAAGLGGTGGTGEEDFSQFFSDYPDGLDDSEYGFPLAQTQYYLAAKDTVAYSTEPLQFSDYGRGWGSAVASGDWLTFVAPASGSYHLLVTGQGPFQGQYSTNPPSPGAVSAAQGSSGRPAFSGAEWQGAVRDQLPFLYAGDFYPADGFFSDTDTQGGPYGPAAHLDEAQRMIDAN